MAIGWNFKQKKKKKNKKERKWEMLEIKRLGYNVWKTKQSPSQERLVCLKEVLKTSQKMGNWYY